MKIAVFMGGISSEREVSIWSGTAILQSLQRQGYDAYGVEINHDNMISAFTDNEYDLAYLAFHGEYGEDGRIQSILDILGKKYTGSGVTASAISMDKILTKKIAQNAGIRTPKTYENIEDIDRYPVIIKPVREGSSVGFYICNDRNELLENIKKENGKDIIIEEYIEGEELTVGVLNGESLGVLRIKPQISDVYDYKAKYTKDGATHEYPARIEKHAYDDAMHNAAKIHNELGLRGLSRSDFLLRDGEVYFLEVNTCPGMTEVSLIPDIATLKGYTYDDLTRIMVETFSK